MSWKNWGDHPIIVTLGIVVGIGGLAFTIYAFYAPNKNPSVPQPTAVTPDLQIVLSTEVELIVQTEQFTPLENVEVRFITKGAPEVRITDSNGYTRLQIPSRGDIEVILSKKDFETLRLIINLGNDSNRTRTYQLKKLASRGSSVSDSSANPSKTPEPTSPVLPTSPSESTQIPNTKSTNPLSPIPRLSEEIVNQKCQEGSAPETILVPKERYIEGEFITIEFANACPNKTVIVVKKAGSPTSGMDSGQSKSSELVREYAGELTFSKSFPRAGNYEIQSYFSPDGRNLFIRGISSRFKVVSKF